MLKVPVTTKELEDGSSSSSSWPAFGTASMQGWRLRMEDAHLALPDFDTKRHNGLFGVFDGHGGAIVAQIAAERLAGMLLANDSYKAGQYEKALSQVFFQMDEHLDSKPIRKEVVARKNQYPVSEDDEDEDDDDDDAMMAFGDEEGGESELAMPEDSESEQSLDGDDLGDDGMDDMDIPPSYNLWMNGEGPDCMGTTAVVALVCKDTQQVFVANAGDSRCILSAGLKVKDLSFDHKPMKKSERMRIKKAGGVVLNPEDGGRVDGNLSLARAFGDFAYKKNKQLSYKEQKITCDPEITCHQLTPEDDFLILGCDGIWEKAESQQVADFVRPRCKPDKKLTNGKFLSAACGAFLDQNLAKHPMADQGLGCDNMTLMTVDLRGRTGSASTPAGKKLKAMSSLVVSRCSKSHRRRSVLRYHNILKKKGA